MILGLDLASTVGWALFHDKQRIASGILELKQRTINKVREPRAVRYIQLADALEQSVLHSAPIPLVRTPDVIVYEAAKGSWLSASAWESYGGLLAEVEKWAYLNGITRMVGVNPTTNKKHATGRGNADKPEMMRAARRLWRGVKLATDDEADALHVVRAYLDGVV